MGRPRANELRDTEIERLFRLGYTSTVLARQFGVTDSNISRVLKERGVDRSRDDNRLNNLRDVSASVNSQNLRGVTRRNVSTGFLGVTQHKLLKKFQSQITCNGKTHYLGLFSSAEAAHSAYLEAKRRLHEGCTI